MIGIIEVIAACAIVYGSFRLVEWKYSMPGPNYAPIECTCVDVDDERLGIQIPDAVLARMGLKLGDPVEIDVTEAGVIIIRKPS